MSDMQRVMSGPAVSCWVNPTAEEGLRTGPSTAHRQTSRLPPRRTRAPHHAQHPLTPPPPSPAWQFLPLPREGQKLHHWEAIGAYRPRLGLRYASDTVKRPP